MGLVIIQYENGEYPDDISLAQKTKNVDVIIGGHTHTFMDAPLLLRNQVQKNVLIHQVGWAGLRLGFLKLQVNVKTREIKYEV